MALRRLEGGWCFHHPNTRIKIHPIFSNRFTALDNKMQILHLGNSINKEVLCTFNILKNWMLRHPIAWWGRHKMANAAIIRPRVLIPLRLSYYPDIISAIFKQQLHGNWQQNGNFVSGYQHHQRGILNFKILEKLHPTSSNRAIGGGTKWRRMKFYVLSKESKGAVSRKGP
jgi:hypothetical protein